MQALLVRLLRIEGASITLILLLAVAIFGSLNPAFLGPENLAAIAVQSMFVLIIAVGMSFVLTSGGIDLSVGAVLGLSGGVTMFLLTLSVPTVLAVVGGLVVGTGFGLLNGLLVTGLGLSDFIVTLATMGVAGGLLQILAYLRPLRGAETDAFTWLSYGEVFGAPFPIVFGFLLVLACAALLNATVFGRRVQASGMSPAGANFAGIDVRNVRLMVFALSGFLAAVSGILLAARLASVQPALGQGYELQAIAAAVLGGTSLAGGRGTIVGTAVAALLLGTINAGLQISGVDPTWYQVFVGGSILAAVAFHQWSERYVDANALSDAASAGSEISSNPTH
ncbi:MULTISPECIES: ABC transporter permease [Mameliella]|uniref:Ribose ABC transporter permease n=1 Tax=Mameliella alba TaxID=561184 RepID=A0A0B3S0M4_9RHOB|nr:MULTISPECIES: ABC transporter permease [Mameliella]KHQ50131.1 Ribose ABC transporter permease [Mameliella alba]